MRHRRLFRHEIRKLDLKVRGFGIQFLLHCSQNFADVLDMNRASMGVEDLNESAHVSALEVVRQIHEHSNGGNRVLESVGLVPDLDGKAQSAHPDFVYPQFAKVPFVLFVVQLWSGGRMHSADPASLANDSRHEHKLTGCPQIRKALSVSVSRELLNFLIWPNKSGH